MLELTEEMMLPIGVDCPHCRVGQLFITGIITAFTCTFPDIFTVDCDECRRTGNGYRRNETEGWKITWDMNPKSILTSHT
jgi:hypothetical protein